MSQFKKIRDLPKLELPDRNKSDRRNMTMNTGESTTNNASSRMKAVPLEFSPNIKILGPDLQDTFYKRREDQSPTYEATLDINTPELRIEKKLIDKISFPAERQVYTPLKMNEDQIFDSGSK